MSARPTRHLAAVAASLLTLSSCDSREPWSPEASSSPRADLVKQAWLRECLNRSVRAPWRSVRVQVNGTEFTAVVRASAADLQLAHRAGDYIEQQYVTVGFARFQGFEVLDPGRFTTLLEQRHFIPLQQLRGTAASTLTPFAAYDDGGGSVALLNVADREYCYAHDTPADWPNPFMSCQAVRGDYDANVTYSTDAIADTPRLLARVRELFTTLQPCFELI